LTCFHWSLSENWHKGSVDCVRRSSLVADFVFLWRGEKKMSDEGTHKASAHSWFGILSCIVGVLGIFVLFGVLFVTLAEGTVSLSKAQIEFRSGVMGILPILSVLLSIPCLLQNRKKKVTGKIGFWLGVLAFVGTMVITDTLLLG
jgi:hypothetical protein